MEDASLITHNDYDQFRNFLQSACGILLGENKQYLVQSRLRRILAEHGFDSLGSLMGQLQRQPRSALREQVVDAMTTNETLWFRDAYPYTILQERLLPELAESSRGQPIRIWSAASSTGQEAYSISMVVDEYRKRAGSQFKARVQIVGTDISNRVLEQAREGVYETLAIGRGLSPQRLQQHFDKLPDGSFRIRPELKRNVEFRPLNLLDSFSGLGRFDVVFCRNVLIYFSSELKLDILKRIHATLKPGGYLILGASESLSGLPEYFEMVNCSPGIVYRVKS